MRLMGGERWRPIEDVHAKHFNCEYEIKSTNFQLKFHPHFTPSNLMLSHKTNPFNLVTKITFRCKNLHFKTKKVSFRQTKSTFLLSIKLTWHLLFDYGSLSIKDCIVALLKAKSSSLLRCNRSQVGLLLCWI